MAGRPGIEPCCAKRLRAPSRRISIFRRNARRRAGLPAPATNASRRCSTSRPRSARQRRGAPLPDRNPALSRLDAETNLQELRGHEEAFKRRAEPRFDARLRRRELARPPRQAARLRRPRSRGDGGRRRPGRAFDCRAPQQLGVDTLIVDRHERIGDNWRKRYHSLTLHNEVHVNHLPYMPFPPTFPVYIPKDMLANWFEAYAGRLELNFWTGTELAAGSYDEQRKQWNVTLRKADGCDARHASAPSHLRHRREQHSVYAGPAGPWPISPAPRCIRATSRTPRNGRAARRWCSAAAPAATTWRRNCRARRRGHHHPAQPDLCGQPEGSAERLRHLFGGHPVRRLRPAGDLVPLSGAAARLSAFHRQRPYGRPQADRRARQARLQAMVRARTRPASR